MTTRAIHQTSANAAKVNTSTKGSAVYVIAELVNDLVALGNELRTDHATFKAVVDDVKTSTNTIRTALSGDYLWNTVTLSVGSTATAVATTAFYYAINGEMYLKAAEAAGTAPGNDVIPSGTFGAVALDIGADGTIDAVEATDNATGYASAVLAAAALPAVAANHVRLGYVTVTKSDGDFTFGTTDLDAVNATAAFTSGTGTMVAALGSAVATSTPAALSAAAVDDISFKATGAP